MLDRANNVGKIDVAAIPNGASAAQAEENLTERAERKAPCQKAKGRPQRLRTKKMVAAALASTGEPPSTSTPSIQTAASGSPGSEGGGAVDSPEDRGSVRGNLSPDVEALLKA